MVVADVAEGVVEGGLVEAVMVLVSIRIVSYHLLMA
jgi:hypothetical protein